MNEISQLTYEECVDIIFKKDYTPKTETEMDIYNLIEGLGGITWRMNHDASDGRIELSEKDTSFMTASSTFSHLLLQKLKEKHNVIPPDECPHRLREFGDRTPIQKAPKGKTYYWDWYKSMQKAYFINEYNNIICSACALHEKNAVEIMKAHIPCDVFPGIIYKLVNPWECAMIDSKCSGFWTQENLYEKIKAKGGEDSVKRFKMKFVQLKLSETK